MAIAKMKVVLSLFFLCGFTVSNWFNACVGFYTIFIHSYENGKQ